MAKKEGNPFVAIGASLGGLLIGAIAIVAVLARDFMWVTPIIAACFVILGGLLAYFTYKAEK
jgi:hypothetical protein